jgi:hypothetical protein
VGDVDVGAEDETILLEPEPHIPDIPDVSSIPNDIEVPLPEDVEAPGMGIVPGSTAAAGAAAPGAVPPPSYMAVDPYISEGEVATVEHAVPLLVVGIAIVPAKPVGAGLTPADVISVAPSGIPVGELADPIPMPSGEVAPIMGVGVTVSSTCAIARLPARNAGKSAAISRIFAGLKFAARRRGSFPTTSLGEKLSDIGQFLVLRWSMLRAWSVGVWLAKTLRKKWPQRSCPHAAPLTEASRTGKWPNPQFVQLNRGLSCLMPDMIDRAEPGGNRLGASHFRKSEH